MNSVVPEMNEIMNEADCIFTPDEVDASLRRMAAEITARLAGSNPLVLCVMNGGLITTGRLLPLLPFPLESGYLHATRYGHETCGGRLEWKARPAEEIRGRTVLLVDDILDEGRTLEALMAHCRDEGAEEVLTAVLVEKVHGRKADPEMKADFIGLVSPDRFLFGCGMDYRGYWRNAPGIYAVKGM